jgi:hypothetical protein
MKTTATTKTSSAIRMLEAMVQMLDQNIKTATGSELVRLQSEQDGVRAQLRKLGA